MPYKVIQIGTGGFGECWCQSFLPPNIADGHIEVVAAVDPSPDALQNAQTHLGLSANRCYTDLARALEENRADFAVIVTPPCFRETIIDAVLAHGLHILSEKPVADTLESAVRIYHKVTAAGKKMAVTMSHRFDQDKTTLREVLRSGKYGAVDYIISRFTCASREYGFWGDLKHDTPSALINEGAIHHLDILRDLAGAECDLLYAQTWNPSWGGYKGDPNCLVDMHMSNGVKCFYEGTYTNAATLNTWCQEYFRVECEHATLILDHRTLRVLRQGKRTQTIKLRQQEKWANAWLIEKFCHWLDGGEPMESHIKENLQASALVFATMESGRTRQPILVQQFLQGVMQNTLVE